MGPRKLWDLESLGIRVGDGVQEIFEDEIRFTGERFSVKLPWKQGHETLSNNFAKTCRD